MAEMQKIIGVLACPRCRAALANKAEVFLCAVCGASYPVADGIFDMRLPENRKKAEAVDWSLHWAEEHQGGFFQKFFSFYRKAVFARTVAYVTNRYFAAAGIFVEAGSGTAETSVRMDKCAGARALVALDIVLPVLKSCAPVMDIRVCGDNFRLPFRDESLDGIWNLGVMEHFTHDKIDEMMREFHRALKPGARLILFWPATNSIPQKLLGAVAFLVNLKKRTRKFQFHPDEISQLRSNREAREVMRRNGFMPLRIDWGLASGMAFKSVIGEKPSAA